MTSPAPTDIPPEVDAAIRAEVALNFPGREIRLSICSTESIRYIVRVHLPLPKLKPSPYVIYEFDRRSGKVTRLEGESAKPYRILNYK